MLIRKISAQFFSIITSPFIVLPISILLVARKESLSNPGYALIFMLIGFLPALTYYFFQNFRHKSLFAFFDEQERYVRTPIFLLATLAFAINYIIFSVDILNIFVWHHLGIILSVFFGLYFIINSFIDKASMHSGTFVFCIVLLSNNIGKDYLLLLILLPLVFFARLELKRHSWTELILGSIIGLILGLLTLNL